MSGNMRPNPMVFVLAVLLLLAMIGVMAFGQVIPTTQAAVILDAAGAAVPLPAGGQSLGAQIQGQTVTLTLVSGLGALGRPRWHEASEVRVYLAWVDLSGPRPAIGFPFVADPRVVTLPTGLGPWLGVWPAVLWTVPQAAWTEGPLGTHSARVSLPWEGQDVAVQALLVDDLIGRRTAVLCQPAVAYRL